MIVSNNITFVDTSQGSIYSGSSRILNPAKITGQINPDPRGGISIGFGSPSGSSSGSEKIFIRDTPILFITSSEVGINTSIPLTNLDIKSPTASSPANLILRTNEDGVVTDGEETGRIIFAIESSSYNFGGGLDFVNSGSTAAIFSRVLRSSSLLDTNHGSLIFEVNDSTNNTEAIEILTLGHGLSYDDVTRGGIYTNTNRPIALLSASLIIDDDEGPFITIRGGTSGVNKIAEIGNITSDATEFLSSNSTGYDKGALRLYNDNSIKIDLNSYGTYSYINDGKLLGIGTTTPTEKLTVQGNISASGTGSFGLIEGGTF
jgi:hypothetical protein